jgi:hypothetical protein
MSMSRFRIATVSVWLAAIFLTGCTGRGDVPKVETANGPSNRNELAVERAKLDPTDRAQVEAQEWCAVSTDERLGSMGPPFKLDIKGQSVFLCCKGCKRKAEADPDKTLAAVADLKVKKAAGPAR